MIPADGEIIIGIANVDEAAITGESAPGDSGKRRRTRRCHRRDAGHLRSIYHARERMRVEKAAWIV